MQIGESFVGVGFEAAHINSVLGERSGPVGNAWASALASPSHGHAPFVTIIRPGLAVQPPTLFVNKAGIGSDRHAEMTWGAAQAGVAGGVADAVQQEIISPDWVGELVIIAAVWVNLLAADATAVFDNNRTAMCLALLSGSKGGPGVDDVLAARDDPWNPFYRSR